MVRQHTVSLKFLCSKLFLYQYYLFFQKHTLIRLFQIKMKELIIKVKVFYGQIIQVTKREEVFVYIIRNTILSLKDMVYVPQWNAQLRQLWWIEKILFPCLYRYQVRCKKNLRSFVLFRPSFVFNVHQRITGQHSIYPQNFCWRHISFCTCF